MQFCQPGYNDIQPLNENLLDLVLASLGTSVIGTSVTDATIIDTNVFGARGAQYTCEA